MILLLRTATDDEIGAAARADDDGACDLAFPEDAADGIDLDKAWHGVHFTLSGTEWDTTPPLGFLLGGRALSGDMGYGPLRAHDARSLRQIAAALPSPEDFARRIDLAGLAGAKIYPDIWDRDDEDPRGYLARSYGSLHDYVTAAVAARKGLFLLLT